MLEYLLLQILLLEEHRLHETRMTADLHTSCGLIQDKLQCWIENLDRTLRNLSHMLNPLDRFAYLLLRMYHTMASIMVSVCSKSSNETSYDDHTSEFISIISCCIQSYKNVLGTNGLKSSYFHHTGDSSSDSTSDMGWIAPLFYTAMKCRHHRMRLQAIRLIESTLHKEGIWDGNIAAIVARKAMALEEREFYDDLKAADEEFDLLSVPTVQELLLPVPPAEHRLKEAKVILPDGPSGRIILKCGFGTKFLPGSSTAIQYDDLAQTWSELVG